MEEISEILKQYCVGNNQGVSLSLKENGILNFETEYFGPLKKNLSKRKFE